ncbi:MAG: response regulator [Planctomycetota bacterium]
MSPDARILVIDDDPLFRSLLAASLDRHTVETAADGSEGYYMAIAAVPDVMILDLQMSGWDGLKTLTMLRGNPLTASVPVIMLTSDGTRAQIVEAVRLGASDYVLKPGFSKDELVAKVEKYLAARVPAAAVNTATVSADSPAELVSSDVPTADFVDDDNWE